MSFSFLVGTDAETTAKTVSLSIISFGNSDRVAHKKRSNSSGENVPKDLLAMFSIIFILTKNQIA